MSTIFTGIFDTEYTTVIALSDFMYCISIALVIGLFLAFCYTIHSKYTSGFIATIALLPAVVCMLIMMVNGNVGTGVAVAGAFSLVRFRSAPGSAKEILAIFIAMTAGIITGTGYLAYAILFTLIMGMISLLLGRCDFGITKKSEKYKTLHITIPEDLNYADIFTDIFEQYTDDSSLVSVKTTNMGSLFKLRYDITLKNLDDSKSFIDALRTRNGNLEIALSAQETVHNEL